jgi:hypothetical protein
MTIQSDRQGALGSFGNDWPMSHSCVSGLSVPAMREVLTIPRMGVSV